MTSPSSRRAGVVQGPQHAATGPEPSSGVGPAFHLGEATPPLRSYLELGALPTAVPCARLHARHVLREWGLNGLSGDSARVLIEVWDADPRAPAPILVTALRLVSHPGPCRQGCLERRGAGEGAGTTARSDK
jgi:hypothetical protein